MLRLKLEYVPYGNEKKARLIGTLNLINDGTGTLEEGNYHADLWETVPDGHALVSTRCPGYTTHYPQKIKGFPRAQRLAWDLVYRALRLFIAYRNPWQGFHYDVPLYIKRGEEFVPVDPFEGFPASGVFIVHREPDAANLTRASHEWIGDVPAQDALTYAAAKVHRERASRALADKLNTLFSSTLKFDRVASAARGGEPIYSYGMPALYDVVDAVLGAIADGELKAKHGT